LFTYDITDDIGGSPTLERSRISLSTNYYPAGEAYQKSTTKQLKTGDCRMQSAFYLNGYIHCVFTTSDNDGYANVQYVRYNVNDNKFLTNRIGLSGFDYAYPSIACFSHSKEEQIAVITFLRTGTNIYPEVRAITIGDDNTALTTGSLQLRQGDNYSFFLSASEPDRWGDYTGICRRAGKFTTPEAWSVGCYVNSVKRYRAYITQLTSDFAVVGINQAKKNEKAMKIYPTIVLDRATIDFETKLPTNITIELINQHGQFIKLLFEEKNLVGKGTTSFNKGVLSSGLYYINLKENGIITKTEKVLVK
jgi:hypothetical protein